MGKKGDTNLKNLECLIIFIEAQEIEQFVCTYIILIGYSIV